MLGEFRNSRVHPSFAINDTLEHRPDFSDTFTEAELLRQTNDLMQFAINPVRKWKFDGKLRPMDHYVFTVYLIVQSKVVAIKDSPSFNIIPIWKAPEENGEKEVGGEEVEEEEETKASSKESAKPNATPPSPPKAKAELLSGKVNKEIAMPKSVLSPLPLPSMGARSGLMSSVPLQQNPFEFSQFQPSYFPPFQLGNFPSNRNLLQALPLPWMSTGELPTSHAGTFGAAMFPTFPPSTVATSPYLPQFPIQGLAMPPPAGNFMMYPHLQE